MTLTPTTTENLIVPSGRVIAVPKCIAQFQPWNGKPISNTFGGKAVLDYEGEPLFAELVVLRILEKEGWQGVWADSYRRKYRVGMLDVSPVQLAEPQSSFLHNIRQKAGRNGGCWDVFAWRGEEYRFAELKRAKKDRIRNSQLRFLEAALDLRLTPANFLLVEWQIA